MKKVKVKFGCVPYNMEFVEFEDDSNLQKKISEYCEENDTIFCYVSRPDESKYTIQQIKENIESSIHCASMGGSSYTIIPFHIDNSDIRNSCNFIAKTLGLNTKLWQDDELLLKIRWGGL